MRFIARGDFAGGSGGLLRLSLENVEDEAGVMVAVESDLDTSNTVSAGTVI